MKIRITDLMDLYEDKNCPLSPVSEPENDAPRGAHCAPLQGGSQEPQEIKASRHAFGWRELASLAAALVLLVLGGFGIKRLIDRGLWQALPARAPRSPPLPPAAWGRFRARSRRPTKQR